MVTGTGSAHIACSGLGMLVFEPHGTTLRVAISPSAEGAICVARSGCGVLLIN